MNASRTRPDTKFPALENASQDRFPLRRVECVLAWRLEPASVVFTSWCWCASL